MHCTNCDYALWNTPAGPCPECGQAFKPSDFRFRQNAVSFRCPGCKQDYYGTDERGHLTPSEFDCVSCARRLTMDEMLILPTEGVDERRTGQETNPWIADDSADRAWRFPRTIFKGAFMPIGIVERTPESSPTGAAVRFVMLLLVCVSVLGLLPLLLFAAIPFLTGGGGGFAGVLGLLLFNLGMFAIPAVLYFLWMVTAHAFVAIGAREERPFRRTVHAMSYTAGPIALVGVPCVGPYLLWLIAIPWWIVTAVIGLCVGTRAPVWRCVTGGLFLPAVIAALLVAGYVGMFAWAFAPGGPIATASAGAGAQSDLVRMDAALGVRRGALPPTHVASLIADETLDPGAFALRRSATNAFELPIANTDALTFSMMSDEEQDATVQAQIESMPEGVFAHRFGDFVFVTDSPTDPSAQAEDTASLWRIIAAPDPIANPGGWSQVWIATPTGIVSYVPENFDSALATQNRIREGLGLPALPHPDQITHDAPAVAD